MSPEPTALIRRALDPSRSVVVEACAGSGKTWLLAARVVRLLAEGAAPGEILAITFTRKAAREIEERVIDGLYLLATDDSAAVENFLVERGLSPEPALVRRARGLYERVLTAQPALTVNTFDAWFLQLIRAAPLAAGLAGSVLVESDARHFDEWWQSFAARLQREAESGTTRAFVALLDEVGLDSTRRLFFRAFGRRSEWLAYGAGRGLDAAEALGVDVQALLGAGAPGEALKNFFSDGWRSEFEAYLSFLEMSELKSDQTLVSGLRAALSEDRAHPIELPRRFAGLCAALLTQENGLRQRKPGAAADKRFGGAANAARFLALHARLGEALLDNQKAQCDERILAFNRQAGEVFRAFLAHVGEFKRGRRQIDFSDAEWAVRELLRDEASAAFLQARLDARYRHVLLDEFQDTNPLQWQILLAWLAAYSDTARPGVFLVGDPKQSIYRFRRAEPRIFSVAADFLARNFAAVRCYQDATRRNAPAIVAVVNVLFGAQAEFAPFRAQTSLAEGVPGRVECLPLFARTAADEGREADEAWRDPLREAAQEPEDGRRQGEAECLAQRIGEIVGQDGPAWAIEDRTTGSRRPARYGDILLLVRSRRHLRVYERALAAAGLPFAAGSRGGLLAALEVRDIVALLKFLATPGDDLSLAQVLRSPVFAFSDDDLSSLALRQAASWWERLTAWAAETGSTGNGATGISTRQARAVRLLTSWRCAAARLPVHDLLDRLYHEGEIVERYGQAVPAVRAAGVKANLQALLLLALDVDGGRYPSLPRFLNKLYDWRANDESDAPDEGTIEALDEAAGRVRILTIHAAKGLEAPVVWLLGANDPPRPREAWDVLVDWPPEEASPRHFSFYGRQEERGQARAPLFDAEDAAARREELNLLYVAMTRARQIFIASGIESSRPGARGTTPYRLIEAALATLGADTAYGEAMPRMPPRSVEPPDTADQSDAMAAPAWPAVGERRREADAAERFGLLLHALVEQRTGGGKAVGGPPTGFSDTEYARAWPIVERWLATDGLRRFFDPARHRRAWNEIELADGNGGLFRLDRLVEFDDALWVLDYKSSGRNSARRLDDQAQVAAYCQAVAEVFPGRIVKGGLIFANARLFEVDWENARSRGAQPPSTLADCPPGSDDTVMDQGTA